MARRCRGDDGVVATVIVLPAALLAIWLVLQYAMVMHVEHVAQAAAQDAALAAAAGTGDAGATALDLMSSADGFTTGVGVRTGGSSTQITVTVTADVVRIFPFGSFAVTASGSAPIEEFIAQPGRP
ncbi:MAG: hypothetical protein M3487_06530 [Actinomycetota bacterium]|nr:pilus assembly protein [Acidimicrobiia bacterium]MDQ3469403.1 hypothetical protein [Actinomycetota bacterium]